MFPDSISSGGGGGYGCVTGIFDFLRCFNWWKAILFKSLGVKGMVMLMMLSGNFISSSELNV